MLALLPNNSQTLALSQLGANEAMHFLGPIRGVLPIGPNGVPAFDTLSSFPLNTTEGMISYNYTLNLQGFSSNFRCIYDSQSPVNYTAVPNNTRLVAYNSTCDGLAPVMKDVVDLTTYNVNSTLTSWACKSVPTMGEQPTYYIYLRGRQNYNTSIGNITCALSPIQPATFPIMYQSGPRIFSSMNPVENFTNVIPGFIERALVATVGVIWEAQGIISNQVAESVNTYGIKYFHLPAPNQSYKYLQLYEAMLQGIFEYEVRRVHSFIPSFSHGRSTGHIQSADIFVGPRPPSLLCSHSEWVSELHGNRLGRDAYKWSLFDSNDGSQLGILGHPLASSVSCEKGQLSIRPNTSIRPITTQFTPLSFA